MAIRINTISRLLVDSGTNQLEWNSRPNVMYGDEGVFAFDCVDDSGNAVAFNESDTFELYADVDFDHTTDQGTANAAYSGAVTSIVVNGLTATLESTGFIILENSSGDRDRVAYTAYDSGTGTFTVDDTLVNSYAEGDTVYIEDQLLLYVGNDDFNNVADRLDVGVTTGKICCRYDALTKGMLNKITKRNQKGYIEIWRSTTTSNRPQKLIQDQIYFSPTVGTIEGSPSTNDPLYLTDAQNEAKYLQQDSTVYPEQSTIADNDMGWIRTLAGVTKYFSFSTLTTYLQTSLADTFLAKLWTGFTDKATPVDADLIAINDSVASYAPKKLTWANVKATLKTYFDAIYSSDQQITGSGTINMRADAQFPTNFTSGLSYTIGSGVLALTDGTNTINVSERSSIIIINKDVAKGSIDLSTDINEGGNNRIMLTDIVELDDTDFTAGLYTISASDIGKTFIVDLTASGTDRTIKIPDATSETKGTKTSFTYSAGTVNLTVTTVGGTQNVGSSTSQVFQKSSESIGLTDDADNYIVNQDSRINKSSVDIIAWNTGVTSILTLEDEAAHFFSAGKTTTNSVTKDEVAGTIDAPANDWYLRSSNDEDAPLKPILVPAVSGIAVPDNSTRYLIADYNSGSPTYSLATDIASIPCQAQCLDTIVSRVNDNIDVLEIGGYANDFMAKTIRANAVTGWLAYGGGLQIADEGNRNFSITAGALYISPKRYEVPALDTSVAGVFTYYYQDGVGGWTEQTSATQINHTQYDNGTGTLTTGATNKYYVHAVYARINTPSEFAVIYPQVEYNSLADAQAGAGAPSVVPAFGDAYSTGRFIGSIITKYNTVAFQDILSPFIEALTSATPVNHNNLSGLQLATTGVTYGHVTDQAQTIYGVKTYNSFSVTPSSAPTTDYQVANKKYVDDNIGSATETTGTILTTATLTFTAIDTTTATNAIQVELNITDVTSNFYYRKRFDVNVADDGTSISYSPPWGVNTYASGAFTIAVALNGTDIEVSITNNTVNTVRYGYKLLDKSEV